MDDRQSMERDAAADRRLRRTALCVISASLAGLAAFLLIGIAEARSETRVQDATGTTVAVPDTGPVVAVGGSITEIVYALGAQERIIAVDSTSLYPAAARAKPDVGYMRRLAAEPILAMEPALILAVEDAGPQSVLDQLREAGLPVVIVPDDPTPDGVIEKIRIVADAMGRSTQGREIADRLAAEFKMLRDMVATTSDRPSVLFLLSVGGGAPLAGGRNTSADSIIRLAGGENVAARFDGYKAFSPEAAVEVAPEVILLTDRTLQQLGGPEGLLAMPQIALTPAGQDVRIVSIDGLLLLGFGPRTGEAIRTLAAELHPGLALPATQSGR